VIGKLAQVASCQPGAGDGQQDRVLGHKMAANMGGKTGEDLAVFAGKVGTRIEAVGNGPTDCRQKRQGMILILTNATEDGVDRIFFRAALREDRE